MATGRIIKTAISVSEQVNDMSLAAALLFTWMIPHADDFGRMAGSARKIKALVVPMRNDITPDKVDKCLEEMEKGGLIKRYCVNGETYIQLPKWDEHQSGLHKRTRSKFPEPEDGEGGDSGKFQEIPSELNRTERKGTEEEKNKRTPKADAFGALQILATFPTLSEAVVKDFIQHRKAKRAPLTQSAWDSITKEIMASGWTPEQALMETMARGWQGFKADWVNKPQRLNGKHQEELTWVPPELRGTPDDPLFNGDYIDAVQ